MVSDATPYRPSLESPALVPLWSAVQSRLERRGHALRGRLKLPPLSSEGQFLLGALLDGPARATLDLAELERALGRLGLGADLEAALARLGFPLSGDLERQRAARQEAAAARAAVRQLAASWGESEAVDWVEAAVQAGAMAGLDVEGACRLVGRARAVLEHVDRHGADLEGRLSRVDLAATVLGSSHALDVGAREAGVVTRALELRHGCKGREAWEAAGVDWDLVSAPVLVWCPVPARGGLSRWLAAAGDLGLPVHLSLLALREQPLLVAPGTDVLVAENPRLVEAAAQQRTPYAAVALNGNPAGAAQRLLSQLRACDAALRYHGDFDAAGLRICARMHRLGLAPWRMGAGDYLQAVGHALADGVDLPHEPNRPPSTPWDPKLERAFERCRRIVHEERLLPGLLESE